MDNESGTPTYRVVYRELFFDEETQAEYLVHGTLEDGFGVYLDGKEIDALEEGRILKLTVFKSEMWKNELERRERAALRLKEQLSSDPFYKDWTMEDWRNLQSSQALAD